MKWMKSAYIRRNLTDEELNQLVLKVQESLENEIAEEGEAVGVIAAQSFGEAITQIFYDSSKKGSDPHSVQYLHRLIEILDARKLISNPTMTIYFDDEYKNDEEFVRKVASQIGKTTLNDVLSEFSLDYANNRLVAYLDSEKIVNFVPVIVMRRLKKKFYLGFYFVTVATLGLVRACMSVVSTDPAVSVSERAADSAAVELADASVAEAAEAVQTVEAAQPAAALEVTETDTPEVKQTPAPPQPERKPAARIETGFPRDSSDLSSAVSCSSSPPCSFSSRSYSS